MGRMTPREVVRRTVTFQTPDRLPRDFPGEFGSDFAGVGMNPSPDARPSSGTDEWGAVWHNIGVSHLGEVKDFPLKDWAEFDRLSIPDIRDKRRWEGLQGARERAGEQFLMGGGLSLYERVHFIRGLENTWTDIYTNPDDLRKLLALFLEELRLTLPVEGLCYSPPDSAECFVAGRGTETGLRLAYRNQLGGQDEGLPYVVDHPRRHPCGRQQRDPLGGGAGGQRAAQEIGEGAAVLHPGLVGGKTRVGSRPLQPQDVAQRGELERPRIGRIEGGHAEAHRHDGTGLMLGQGSDQRRRGF